MIKINNLSSISGGLNSNVTLVSSLLVGVTVLASLLVIIGEKNKKKALSNENLTKDTTILLMESLHDKIDGLQDKINSIHLSLNPSSGVI